MMSKNEPSLFQHNSQKILFLFIIFTNSNIPSVIAIIHLTTGLYDKKPEITIAPTTTIIPGPKSFSRHVKARAIAPVQVVVKVHVVLLVLVVVKERQKQHVLHALVHVKVIVKELVQVVVALVVLQVVKALVRAVVQVGAREVVRVLVLLHVYQHVVEPAQVAASLHAMDLVVVDVAA